MEDTDQPFTGRATHRLTLDSEEDMRIEQQEEKRRQQKRLKKLQRRRKRQQAEKAAQQQEFAQILQEQNKEDDNINLFQEDSNSHHSFNRTLRKIKKYYPEYRVKDQNSHHRKSKKKQTTPQQSQSSEESQEKPKREKKTKGIEKKKQPNHENQTKNKPIKIEHQSDKKEYLVEQIAIRWWYALPQWPPADFDFQKELKAQGYRSVQPSIFRHQEQFINGLQKVVPVDGFKGVYRSKLKLIDIRPKHNAPSLDFFNNKSIDQLSLLLKTALKEQISQLKNVKYQQSGQKELLDQLQKQFDNL